MQGDYCLRSNEQIAINSSWLHGNDGIISASPNSSLNQAVVNKHENTGVTEYRHWKMELSKDYMGFFNALRYGYPAQFNPTYLTSNQVIKVNIPRIGKRKPWRHASPGDSYQGRINYTSCWNKDTLVLNGGTYQNMVLVINCRIDITKSVSFNNMILITTKGGKASIEARQ